jgi:von Willebrand factor A domain-containing protein 5
MQIFLRSLPLGTKFNITFSFGSIFNSLFPSSVLLDDDTLATSSSFVANLRADMGGTEMLQPIRDILRLPVLHSHPRQLIIVVSSTGEEEEREEKRKRICKTYGHVDGRKCV